MAMEAFLTFHMGKAHLSFGPGHSGMFFPAALVLQAGLLGSAADSHDAI